jgi:nucleoside-diphosphate-sugar epimerase
MRILIIGGTLFIGRRLAETLVRKGHDLTILHRNPQSQLPAGARGIVADRNDAAAVARALAGQRFDAVFDNVYDWERGTTAAQVQATARACAHPNLERYVFMSSVAAYGEGLDHDEDDPLAPPDHPEAYVHNKAESERALFSMHRQSGFPAVTLRPPFVYGPGNPFYREAFFWDRIEAGRPIIVPDDGSRLMQFVYVDDVVSCCVRVLEEPQAIGQAFNVAHERAITQNEAVQAFARAAGRRARIVHLPRRTMVEAGGHPMGPKLYFAMYYDLPPITMRVDKAKRMLGFTPSNFDEALRRTFEWWRRAQPFPLPDYSFEDELLSRANLAPGPG